MAWFTSQRIEVTVCDNGLTVPRYLQSNTYALLITGIFPEDASASHLTREIRARADPGKHIPIIVWGHFVTHSDHVYFKEIGATATVEVVDGFDSVVKVVEEVLLSLEAVPSASEKGGMG